MEGSGESGNSPTDDDGVVVVFHWGDYISETLRWLSTSIETTDSI
jgi:hypothetical protein